MPLRIRSLASVYVFVFIALACYLIAMAVLDAVDDATGMAATCLHLAYLAIALPIGFWAAISKSRASFRLGASLSPALAMTVFVIMERLVTSFSYQGIFLVDDVASGVTGFLTFLIPVGLGAAAGFWQRRRGLSAIRVSSGAVAGPPLRFTLFQLFCITLVAAVSLGAQPLLQAASGRLITFEELSDERALALLEAEPPLVEQAFTDVCWMLSFAMPFLWLSMASLWAAFTAGSFWKAIVWGTPAVAYCSVLLHMDDLELVEAVVFALGFYVVQFTTLWMVRSAGYRLSWAARDGVSNIALGELHTAIVDPAIA